jgi:hypothetical protein
MTLSGDHGGISMKMIGGVAAREGDGQSFTYVLGIVLAKETFSILSSTLMPPLNEGYKTLSETSVIIVEWGTGFVFALVPRIDCDRTQLPCSMDWVVNAQNELIGVSWADGGIALFECPESIPADRAMWTIKCLPIIPVCTGDLAYTFLLQGRGTYCGVKCLLCRLRSSQWQVKPTLGELWTIDSMVSIVRNNALNEGNILEDADVVEVDVDGPAADERNLLIREMLLANKEASVEAGLTDKEPLLTSIPMQYWTVPVLHIKLGLTLTVLNQLFKFIHEKLELYPQKIMDAQIALADKQQKFEDLIIIINSFDSDSSASMKEMKKYIKEYKRVKTVIARCVGYKKAETRAQHVDELNTATDSLVEINAYFFNEFNKVEDEAVEHVQGILTAHESQVTEYNNRYVCVHLCICMSMYNTYVYIYICVYVCTGRKRRKQYTTRQRKICPSS